MHDVAIIGGGPAGAHAAAKAALLFRTAVLFDKGRKFSRIYWSPRVANLPGRLGEPGRELVAKGYSFIEEIEADLGRRFVTVHENANVTGVERIEGGFRITAEGKDGAVVAEAKAVVLATGCVDAQPKLRDFRKRDIEAVLPFANKGLADYCLLCDGHTVAEKRVAVIGCSPGVRGIAKSLKKNFGAQTALVPMCNVDDKKGGMRDPREEWSEVEEEMARWEIPIHFGGVKEFTGIKDGQFAIVFNDGRTELFDKAWISMGWYRVNNEFAVALGGHVDDDGFVLTDGDGRMLTDDGPASDVYVIGDLRSDSWKQVPIAWGEAEQAIANLFVYG